MDITASETKKKNELNATVIKAIESSDTEETIIALIKKGADVNAADRSGRSLLCLASDKRYLSVVLFLIGADANIDTPCELGNTPLICAAATAFEQAALVLIERGANVHTRNLNHFTALMHAAEQGCEKTVSALLKAGALVDPQNQQGKTALMLATEKGHLNIVHALIHAADNANELVNLVSKEGWTALTYATANARQDIVVALKGAGATNTSNRNVVMNSEMERAIMNSPEDASVFAYKLFSTFSMKEVRELKGSPSPHFSCYAENYEREMRRVSIQAISTYRRLIGLLDENKKQVLSEGARQIVISYLFPQYYTHRRMERNIRALPMPETVEQPRHSRDENAADENPSKRPKV